MTYLLDTSFLSEFTKPVRDEGVEAWLRSMPLGRLHISAISIAEIRFGVERLEESRRREVLERFLEHDLSKRFAGRILPVGERVAHRFGRLKADLRRRGKPIDDFDTLIASTALVHDLFVVTRNEKHFLPTGAPVVNPWTAG